MLLRDDYPNTATPRNWCVPAFALASFIPISLCEIPLFASIVIARLYVQSVANGNAPLSSIRFLHSSSALPDRWSTSVRRTDARLRHQFIRCNDTTDIPQAAARSTDRNGPARDISTARHRWHATSEPTNPSPATIRRGYAYPRSDVAGSDQQIARRRSRQSARNR